MKAILSAAAIAAISTASPAFAQPGHSPLYPKSPIHTHSSRDVYAPNGTYLGSDPDPNVRLEMRRDECRWGC